MAQAGEGVCPRTHSKQAAGLSEQPWPVWSPAASHTRFCCFPYNAKGQVILKTENVVWGVSTPCSARPWALALGVPLSPSSLASLVGPGWLILCCAGQATIKEDPTDSLVSPVRTMAMEALSHLR